MSYADDTRGWGGLGGVKARTPDRFMPGDDEREREKAAQYAAMNMRSAVEAPPTPVWVNVVLDELAHANSRLNAFVCMARDMVQRTVGAVPSPGGNEKTQEAYTTVDKVSAQQTLMSTQLTELQKQLEILQTLL